MKTPLRHIVIACFIAAAAAVEAAPNLAGTDVTVRRQGGTATFRGTTDASGKFATGVLAPGSYTLEVRSNNPGAFRGELVRILISGGRGSAITESNLPGNQFGGGVAMNFVVTRRSAIEGQVTTASMSTLAPGTVRLINGKRYVWMPPEVGTQMGGRWVREGTSIVPGGNVVRTGPEWLGRQQDMAGQQRGRP